MESGGDSNTYVIPNTESIPDQYGVYEAQVVVDDTPKWTNDGKSTFFPDTWTDADVILAIDEAYKVKIPDPLGRPNVFVGKTSKGMQIEIIVDKNDKIKTAFPQKQEKGKYKYEI